MTRSKSWIEQTADKIEEFVRYNKGASPQIICASGISPSGPIHLGNLREIITVHLVTEELRRRGQDAEHIHSWDDFDRLRKVPVGHLRTTPLVPVFITNRGQLCDGSR